MQFPGYWVSGGANRVFVRQTVFDETELDPARNWKEAITNLDTTFGAKGFVERQSALVYALELIKGSARNDRSEPEETDHSFESAEALKQFFEG
jgi:hypothetical protein